MKKLSDEQAALHRGGIAYMKHCAASIGFSAAFGGLFGGVGAVVGAFAAATGPACLGLW